MCRIGYLHFDPSVPQKERQRVARAVLKRSWDMGNKHGCGLVSWTPGTEEAPRVERSLQFSTLVWPASLGTDVLLHARYSTNKVALNYTHPFVAGGVYLVHNGIVHAPNAGRQTELSQKAKTDNDSELILKSYLGQERSLKAALSELSGMANVMVWDSTRGVLSLHSDARPFAIWRQDGVTAIVQDNEQATSFIKSGLGFPYEYDTMPADKAVEVSLTGHATEADWTFAFETAIQHAHAVKRPSYFSKPTQTNYIKTTQQFFDTYGTKSAPKGGTWVHDGKYYVRTDGLTVTEQGYLQVNGRTYTADGRLVNYRQLSQKDRKKLRRAMQAHNAQKDVTVDEMEENE